MPMPEFKTEEFLKSLSDEGFLIFAGRVKEIVIKMENEFNRRSIEKREGNSKND